MSYITGCVAAVPTANRDAFIAHAKIAAEVFRDHGATQVVDGWGVDVPEGELTSFPMAVKRQAGEEIVFSWIVWPSKAQADKAMEAMMADPRMSPEENPMPFDGKRMIFGGFEPVFEA